MLWKTALQHVEEEDGDGKLQMKKSFKILKQSRKTALQNVEEEEEEEEGRSAETVEEEEEEEEDQQSAKTVEVGIAK